MKQQSYDHLFEGNATQEEIFQDIRVSLKKLYILIYLVFLFDMLIIVFFINVLFLQYLVQSVVDGYNVYLFAYG